MSNYAKQTFNTASQEAHAGVRSIVDDIERAIRENEITDEETLSDFVHQAIDDALTYTSDAWLFAYGLPEGDTDDFGGLEGCGDISAIITRQAYANLREAISFRDFSEDLAVASDARAEQEAAS